MELLKQAQGMFGKKPSSSSAAPPAANASESTGQQDALDKGVDAVLKKAGHGQSAATTEKISDGIRVLFKKITGKDVPIADKS